MIICLDVHYEVTTAFAAGVAFNDWGDSTPVVERVVKIDSVQPYAPGQFFRRELPCLLAALEVLPKADFIIVDGYVWLDGDGKPGLGAHLHTALKESVIVVGVAKTEFQGAQNVQEVSRGKSTRPLFVTAVGISVNLAAQHIHAMHGPDRIPTMLRRVDFLARQAKVQ